MVKKDNPKNITFNLGSDMPVEGNGIKKKRRGRPKKVAETEVIIKEKLPHQKFSHKSNKALDQLLEAKRDKERAELEKGLRSLAGVGFNADKFLKVDRNHPINYQQVPLPIFGDWELELPPFFIVKTKKGWRLANPLTEIRNLATRKGKGKSLQLVRRNTDGIGIEDKGEEEAPTLDEFSDKDQNKIIKYFTDIQNGINKDKEYETLNKPRGFPAVLYKNAKKAGYKETKEKVYRKNDLKPKKLPAYKVPVGRPERRRRRIHLVGESDEEGEESGTDRENEELALEQKENRDKLKAEKLDTAKKVKEAKPLTEEEWDALYEKWDARYDKDYWDDKLRYARNGTSFRRDFPKYIVKDAIKYFNEDDQDRGIAYLKRMEAYDKRSKDNKYGLPPKYQKKWEIHTANEPLQRDFVNKAYEYIEDMKSAKAVSHEKLNEIKDYIRATSAKRKADTDEARDFKDKTDYMYEKLKAKYTRTLEKRKEGSASGLDYNSDTDAGGEGDKATEQDGGCDGEGSAGSLLGDIGKKAYDTLVKPKVEAVKKNIHRITHPTETLQEAKDFGRHLIHGRHDAYPPSAQKVIDENKDAIVQSITLHRNPLPSAYTKIMSWATKGETDKRIAEQPKDTLYHIGMWVKLSNGKTIKVEKNEVINIDPHPKKPKEEEVFQVPAPPANLTFGEMLSKTREAIGDHKFFSYSAKDNNCGNFIEAILKTNGMDSEATHDFIGQDAKAILKGFSGLRKFMNTLTDTAGRANVLLEGGKISDSDSGSDSDSDTEVKKIDWEDIKWGSFTKQFEEYKRQHPNSKIDDLEHFAESILANPEDYKKSTLKRARFYINVLSKKKLSHHNNIMPTQGGRMIGLARPAVLPAHIGHPALVSDQYPRIPQAFTQVHLASPVPIGHGLYAGGGGSGGDLLDDIYGGARHLLGVGVRPMPVAMRGGDIWGDIGRAFDPKKNGVAKAFDPKQNGVSNAFNKTFTPQLGRDITSGLIHQALPAVISGVAGSATSALTGNPALGFAVGQTAGKYAGKEAGDALGKATGYGLGGKMPRFKKGSKEAKEYMASIRRKKGSKGGAIPAPHSRSPITDPSLL